MFNGVGYIICFFFLDSKGPFSIFFILFYISNASEALLRPDGMLVAP